MTTSVQSIQNVEQWNDRFARTHDIDDYYACASWPVRLVEGRRLSWIRRAVGSASGMRLLEVGCGGGHILNMFPEANRTGIDVSGVMIEKARRNLSGHDVQLLKGDLESSSLEPHSFDCVICTEVIEHVVDPDALLTGIARMLVPGGKLVITFPNDRLINGIKRVLIRSGLTRIPGLSRISWGGDEFHLHTWRTYEMRQLLAKHFTAERASMIPSRLLPIRCGFVCSVRDR